MSESKGIARRDYQPTMESELRLHEGDLITDIQRVDQHWCSGSNETGETGLFPGDDVEIVREPDGYELRRTSTGYVPRLMPKAVAQEDDHEDEQHRETIPGVPTNSEPVREDAHGASGPRATFELPDSSTRIARDSQTKAAGMEGADGLSDDYLHPGIRPLRYDGRNFRHPSDCNPTLMLTQAERDRRVRVETQSWNRPRTERDKSATGSTDLKPRTIGRTSSKHNVSNGFENCMPEQLEMEIMTEIQSPDFRIADMRHRYTATYDRAPATASVCSYRGEAVTGNEDRDHLHIFQDIEEGMLIVENLDVPWIEKLTRSGVPLSFLLDHVLRVEHNHNHLLAEKLDTLRRLDQHRNVSSALEIVHWDAQFGDAGRAVQILRRSGDPTFNAFVPRADYTRLSFCRIGTTRYVALVDRAMMPSTNIPFIDGKPILSAYLPGNGEGFLSLKHSLDMYFWRKMYMYRRALLLFDDALTLWWDMAADAFLSNLTLFSQELKYFTFEAINQPQISDFRTLNRDRRHVDQIVTYLNICVGQVPMVQAQDAKMEANSEEAQLRAVQMKVFQLQSQATKMRQEFNDTFQLLIGVLSVLDSEVSKTQAQRSTALTVLAAIYLPFSLATGVYGMNIAEINNHAPKWWAVIALGLALLCLTLIVVYFVLRDKTSGDRRSIDSTGVWHVNNLERGLQYAAQEDIPLFRPFKMAES